MTYDKKGVKKRTRLELRCKQKIFKLHITAKVHTRLLRIKLKTDSMYLYAVAFVIKVVCQSQEVLGARNKFKKPFFEKYEKLFECIL